MISAEHRRALAVVVRQLAGLDEPWLVTGSTAAALHGADLCPGDIDVESTATGAYAIGTRLAPYQVKPVQFGEIDYVRSHFGVFNIQGVTVEVMGDLQTRTETGWSAPFASLAGRTLVTTPDGSVPVPGPEALAGHYARFGLLDKERAVRAVMSP